MIDTVNGRGCIFDIQRYSVHDGPGIRTTVFFKGCPLECIWCDNPESQEFSPQMLHFQSLCVRCYRCVESCPSGATSITPDGAILVNRALCKACGKCVKVCPSNARSISGKWMTLEEVMEVLKRDAPFYRVSGGGITASGGEATCQQDFLIELLKSCQKSGLHTCLETCGYTHGEIFEEILENVDLVLYDIKHMDSMRHIQLTGIGNELILDNAQKVVQKGVPLVLRMPVIPDYNDSGENIKALGKFAAELRIARVDLLPYHEFGMKKYEALGRNYKVVKAKEHDKHNIQEIKALLESYGLEVSIV